MTVQTPAADLVSATTSRRSFGEVWYSKVRCFDQPCRSGRSVVTLRGQVASGLYAAQAAFRAASASLASDSGTSIIASQESPSGAPRIVAGPRTLTVQPAGA